VTDIQLFRLKRIMIWAGMEMELSVKEQKVVGFGQ
jgi:hypothetical protein